MILKFDFFFLTLLRHVIFCYWGSFYFFNSAFCITMAGVYSIIFLLVDAPEGAMLFEIQKKKPQQIFQ